MFTLYMPDDYDPDFGQKLIQALRDPNQLLIRDALGPVERLAEHLKLGADISTRESMTGDTALHIAAEEGNLTNVKFLMDRGASWSIYNANSCMPMDLALLNGYKECYDLMFEHAANEEYRFWYGERKPHTPNSEWDNKPYAFYDNKEYLSKSLKFGIPHDREHGQLGMYCSNQPVMTEGERPLMKKTAELLFDGLPKGKRCLNIGFGIGIIDGYIQDQDPVEHVIIEAHPDCLNYMHIIGWDQKPNVRILAGRWQDFIGPKAKKGTKIKDGDNTETDNNPKKDNTVSEEGEPFDIGTFDVIYFDTYQESYNDHLELYMELPRLLSGPDARFSHFRGLLIDSPTGSEVYKEVTTRHFRDIGLNTVWHEGVDRSAKVYKISICSLAPTIRGTFVFDRDWRRIYTDPTFPRSPLSDRTVPPIPAYIS